MRWIILAFAAVLVFPLAASAEEPQAAEDVTNCVERNVPEPDSIRAVRVVARDRLGVQRVTVVKIYGRWGEHGRRELLVRFSEPEDVRGSSLLMLEREGDNEIYFKSSEVERVKRIKGVARAATLFGSDFSYEDFEHLQGFSWPGESKRLEDAVIGDRPVYILETRPEGGAESAYESVVTFVDKETCVALRIELYEPGRQLRKVLTIDPSGIRKRGSSWIAHTVLLRDIRDYTTTQILVDSTEQEPLSAKMFTVEALRRAEN